MTKKEKRNRKKDRKTFDRMILKNHRASTHHSRLKKIHEEGVLNPLKHRELAESKNYKQFRDLYVAGKI